MANEERGEVELVVSDERSYTLALTMNGIAEMQTRLGKTYGEAIKAVRGLDMIVLRAMLHMALQKHHAKEFPQVTKAGDLIDSLDGGMMQALRTLSRLIEINAQRPDAEHGNGRPPEAP